MNPVSTYPKITPTQLTEAKEKLKKFIPIEFFGVKSTLNSNNTNNPRNSFSESPCHFKASICAGEDLFNIFKFKGEYIKNVGNAPSYIFAEKIVNENLPTILFYSNYDIESIKYENGHNPYFPQEGKDSSDSKVYDRLYGAGSCCGKGGIVAMLSVLNIYQKAKLNLPVNVKVLFDGERKVLAEKIEVVDGEQQVKKVGSPHLQQLVEKLGDKLKADALIFFDGMNMEKGMGSLSSFTNQVSNVVLKEVENKNPEENTAYTKQYDICCEGVFTNAYVNSINENFAKCKPELYDKFPIHLKPLAERFPKMEIIIPALGDDPLFTRYESLNYCVFERAINSLSGFLMKAGNI